VLIAELKGVGRDFPLSIEKLSPVLSFYVVADWKEGCARCIEILRYGGMGHTMSIHSQNDDVILQFGLKKPAFRICVNTPTTHGSIGLTTGLDPAMTLGCGGWGGNITSDNISPKHLLNIKRVAYETQPAASSVTSGSSRTVAAPTPRAGLNPDVLGPRIDQFLASRGIPNPEPGTRTWNQEPERGTRNPEPGTSAAGAKRAAEFVCEEDVRQAVRAGLKIVLDSRTIVTPAARDLGDEKRVFVDAR
jgi:acetaldehyde dehydrogenase (acetylating)